MDLKDKIAELVPGLSAGKDTDVRDMQEDIYFQFSKLDAFEVLRIEQTGDPERQVIAACLSTMPDPLFEMVIKHVWETDLAYDNQWHGFYIEEQGTVFKFLTWEDEFIAGEIWFNRVKAEEN